MGDEVGKKVGKQSTEEKIAVGEEVEEEEIEKEEVEEEKVVEKSSEELSDESETEKKVSPSDDEISFIGDDIAEEEKVVAASIEERMKKAYNKKLTDLDKEYKGKKVVGSYDDLLNQPEFLSWAQGKMTGSGVSTTLPDVTTLSMDQALQNWPSMDDNQRLVYWRNIPQNQQELFKLKLQVASMAASSLSAREVELEKAARTEYGEDVFNAKKEQINRIRREIQRSPFLSHSEAFKMLDYLDYGKRMLEQGRKEGEKNVKSKKGKFVPAGKGVSGAGKKVKKAKSMKEAYDLAEEEEEK